MSLHFYSTNQFVQRLLDKEILTDDQLMEAVSLRQTSMFGIDLVAILASLGHVDLRDVCQDIAERFEIDFVDLASIHIPDAILRAVDGRVARFFRVVPVGEENEALVLAMDDPTNISILQNLEKLLKRPVAAAIATPDDITAALDRYYAESAKG